MPNTPISLAEPSRPMPIWRLDRSVPAGRGAVELDPAQAEVVAHRTGPLLVLAGPGTGKTHTLTEAVIARLEDATPLAASEVLVLTFARKAAREIRDRIAARRGGGEVPTVCTFHSLALGIVREFGAAQLADLRLVTAPEQEIMVQEVLRTLLSEAGAASKVAWPESLAPALTTRGLAVEVRNAMARARALGLEPNELNDAAVAAAAPEWAAVSRLLGQYLESAEERRLLDYNELILAAVELARTEPIGAHMRNRYRAIFVDEYQDTDPLQIELLQQLTRADGSLVAVGDPDQSIYGFRGAEPKSVARFAADFAHMNANGPAKITALTVNRRATFELRAAAMSVISRAGVELLPAALQGAHRELSTPSNIAVGLPPSFTEYDSAEVEAEEVAEQIRRLVLERDSELQWRDIAVLVRSGTRSIPLLQRALLQADVPVVTTYDDLPLASEPAVRTLLLALRCAREPQLITQPATARELLTSELGRLDPAELRRISKLVRDDSPGFSEVRLAAALADPKVGSGVPPTAGGTAWQRFVALRDLLAKAHAKYLRGASVHELLWLLWDGTDWPGRLRHRALSEGPSAANANHELDVVIALMDLAAASSKESARSGQLANFVDAVSAMMVAEQPAESAVAPNAVALMTAHRAKGLEWEVVFVCSADEQTWPDLRRRTSLFEPDRLRATSAGPRRIGELGQVPERYEVVAEERRLFYVACTRARQQLFVSSTSADREAGRLPSRFISQLIGESATAGEASSAGADLELAPQPHYSANGLVAQLRRLGTAAGTSPAQRIAVAHRLAALARLQDPAGRAAVPAADPRAWWGTAAPTEHDVPVEALDRPVHVRGSSFESLQDCALKWFFDQRAHAEEPKGTAMAFGSVVHACADAVLRGEVPPDEAEIRQRIQQIWPDLRFETSWQSAAELADASACIRRFLEWLAGRPAVAARQSEVAFDGSWSLTLSDGSTDQLRLKGKIDVVELHADGSVFVIDFKTSGTVPSFADAERNPQLALYQTAVEQGLLDSVAAADAAAQLPLHANGAELVYLRVEGPKKQPGATIRPQPPIDDWFEPMAAASVARLRAEDYRPTAGAHCQFCSFKSLCPVFAEGKPVLP